MHIPITFNPSFSSSSSSIDQKPKPKLPSALTKISNDEVVLIELQGQIEVESVDVNEKNGKFVGKLTIDESGSGKPTLLIGHHVLEGKITQLVKPLAVLNRSIPDASLPTSLNSRDSGEEDVMNVDDDNDESHLHTSMSTRTPSQTRWEAVAIVKRKIVFSKRPMLMVGRST